MKSLLLHCCCAPCSLGALWRIIDDYSITLLYYNPCIISGEYEKRLSALKQVAAIYDLPLKVIEQNREGFLSLSKNREHDKEGGERCKLCIGDRIGYTASLADSEGFDLFTTTLSVSPHKDYKYISQYAQSVAKSAAFLDIDFKKQNGFLKSVQLSKQYNIYRQNFCGCEFSVGGYGS